MLNQNTAVISISLPRDMKERISKRVKEDQYGTPSDYIRTLVREDIKKRDQERLEEMLIEGIHSGNGAMVGTKEWKKFRQDVLMRIQKNK